jgi:Tfp pilus assembly protein PilV
METMVAMMVIVIGLSALQHYFPQGLATGRHAVERTQATLLGRGQLERLRLQGFATLATTHLATTPELFLDSQEQAVSARFRWQAEVTRPAEDLLAIHLRVVWPWPAQTHQVHLATYVSQH